MGNSKSSKLETSYDSKPTHAQLEQAIETLRAYRLYTTSNDKYSTAIGKFLNEFDQLNRPNYNISPPITSNPYKHNHRIQNKPSTDIAQWLKNKHISDYNIEYMLKLQDITHFDDLQYYKQHQWNELYQYCVVKCCKNRGIQYTNTMKKKMKKLLTFINEKSVNIILIHTEATINKKNNHKLKKKKKVKLNRHNPIKRKKNPKQTDVSKSSANKPFDNQSISEQNKQFSYKEILVSGYIRDIGETLLSDIIIPIDICHLCLKYFSHNEIFLFTIPITNNTPICVKVRNNFYSKHNMKIFELKCSTGQNIDSTTLTDSKWMIKGCSLYFEQNIKLPSAVTSKLNNGYNKYYKCVNTDYYKHFESDTYSIIFNRGGGHRHGYNQHKFVKKCYAIAFNDRELYKSDTRSVVGFKYSLPNCKRELSSLLYSDRYGLIAVGGGISIYNLSFRNKEFYGQNKKEWKWLSFGHLQERRKQFSTVMLDAKRLMIVGGDKVNDPKSELIDLSGHRNKRTMVTDCNSARSKTGIFYDNYNKRVFVGGGHYMKTKLVDEYYDVDKNKWYIYAQRENINIYEYQHWPVLFSTDKEIIYMTDGCGNFRCKDLRENTQQWAIYNPNISVKNYLQISHNLNYRVVS